MRNTKLFEKRNKSLKEDFNELSKKYPKQYDLVFKELSEKYYITSRTIEAVLRGEYEYKSKLKTNPNQLTIF